MFLSKLTLNRQSGQVVQDLGSIYEMHRTLMRAFGTPAGRVLFRLELAREEDRAPVVLVQSEQKPDWGFALASNYAEVQGPKLIKLKLEPGRRLRFRLRANPSVKRDGKRVGLLTPQQQEDWLRRKGAASGFEVLSVAITRSGKQLSARRPRAGGVVFTHAFAEFEGILRVTDAALLTATLQAGVGAAKGFGFGLLSLAPG